MTSIDDKVSAVFKEVIGPQSTVDKEILVYNEFPGWDSVAHMTLIAGLEEKFDCMIDMDDILDMSSYHKAVEIMAKHVESA